MKKSIERHTLQTARPYLMKEKNRCNSLLMSCHTLCLWSHRRDQKCKKNPCGANPRFRRPYLMRARQTKVIPCRKLSGGGIPELIQNIWVSLASDQKAKTQSKLLSRSWSLKYIKKNHKLIIREDNYVFNETGDLLLQELIKIFGQSLGTKKLVHIFGRWDTRWPPKRLGWRQSWNFRPPLRSISSQHQTNRHSVRRWIKQETDVVV